MIAGIYRGAGSRTLEQVCIYSNERYYWASEKPSIRYWLECFETYSWQEGGTLPDNLTLPLQFITNGEEL